MKLEVEPASWLVRKWASRWHANPCKLIDMNMMTSTLTKQKGVILDL